MGKHSFETILYEQIDGIVTITLNRPASFNAFTPLMNKEIKIALETANKDDTVRVIILTGEGKAFCAGQDIHTIDADVNYANLLRENYHPMVNTLKSIEKPTIAAVNGVAAGAGMSLALLTDFRLIHEDAKFVSAFMDIGLIPDSGYFYILPRLIGYSKALEIITLKKTIDSNEAVDIGLATKIIPRDEWNKKVFDFAKKFEQIPTKAFSLIKRYMLDSMHLPIENVLKQEAEAQRIASLSKDHHEGLSAFLEKRPAEFSGK